MANKRDLYDVLGVSPSADQAEIDAAYAQRAREQLEAGGPDGKAEADPQLENAYWTLSNPRRRALYDANQNAGGLPLQVSVEVKEPKHSLQRTLMLLIGGVLAAGVLIQITFLLTGVHRQSNVAVELQREKVQLQEQRQEYGNLSPQEIAARRQEEEQQRQEREKRLVEDKERQQLEESRRYAEQVSQNLHQAEEQARREAEYEKARQEAEANQRQEEEKQRLERIRRGGN